MSHIKRLASRLRIWLLLKLAGGMPVAINLQLTRGLYIYGVAGLHVNVHVDPTKEDRGAPDGCGVYITMATISNEQKMNHIRRLSKWLELVLRRGAPG